MPVAEHTRSTYRADIDGLRAIAVSLVILFHFGAPAFGGGFVGVDIFFVISGFLITGILAKGQLGLAQFYARRVQRIMPALLLVVGVSLLLGQFLIPALDRASLQASAFYSAVSLANFYFFASLGYFDGTGDQQPLLDIWSLSVEEQFYMVWPIVVIALLRISRGQTTLILSLISLLILVSFSFSVYRVSTNQQAAFFLPGSRAWEFGIGAALAFMPPLAVHRWFGDLMRLAGLAAIGYSATALTDTSAFPGANALLPCIGAAMIICPLTEPARISGMLGAAPLRFIGLISYSLYLWHWPVLVFFRYWNDGQSPTPPVTVALGALSVLLSVLSWRFVEQPARAPRVKPVQARWLTTAFAVLTATGIVTWTGRPDTAPSADQLIVREQLARAGRVERPDVAFFGDSSCLTGIYPPTVAAELGRTVQSFCMFGSAGPVADARAIELLAKRGALPKIAVIVIHPRQFGRNGTSDEWTSYISAQNPTAVPDRTPPTPLTGTFAGRYPNAAELVGELRSSRSLVDSSRGASNSSKVSLGIPPSFTAHVAPLASALKAFDPSNLYLVTPPLTPGVAKEDRDKAASTVATILGIPHANILTALFASHVDA